ncbi:MAG: ABC transporter permease [Nitrosomonadales bacterium]|nr:ABC transporter permease [Nitrosomonadales bacterium]
MDIRQVADLVFYKAYADLRAEAARSYLGLLWWVIEPILYLSAFYVLFVMVFQRGGPDFVPALLCGTVVWKWFASGLNGGGNSISSHGGLLQQVYVPKYVFPVIAMLGSTARFIPVFSLYAIFLILYGFPVQYTWLGVLPVMLVQFCLVLSLSMLVGAITPFLPDIRIAIDNGLMLLFFISGVFFNINEVHEPLRSYLLLNPMAGLIDEYRNVMMRGIWPDTGRLAVILASSIALGTLALALLKQMDHKYGKVRF